MRLGDPVRFYEGEWFSEGTIIAVEPESVTVDFMDWKQRFKPTELQIAYIHFARVLTVTGPGEILEDFRD